MLIRLILSLALLTAAPRLAAQLLVCPGSSTESSGGCELFHYHVQMWDPEGRRFVEIFGANRFASMTACERARAVESAERTSAITEAKKREARAKLEQDRFGACHCDMTDNRSSSVWLDEQRRLLQLRTAAAIAAARDEQLARIGVPPPRASRRPSPLPPDAWPKSVSLAPPAATRNPPQIPPDLIKPTSVGTDAPKGSVISDLPLIEVPLPTAGASATATAAVRADDRSRAAAHDFIESETRRVQATMSLLESVGEVETKGRVFEACMQRLQLLSNLRRLIEASGDGRLASSTARADDDPAKRQLVDALFGSSVAAAWFATNPAEAAVELPAEVMSDPVAVLRDSTARFSPSSRSAALYLVLARASLAPAEEVWIQSMIESLLAGKEQP